MEATCIAVPIKKEGLPTSVITETGQIVTVNGGSGKAPTDGNLVPGPRSPDQ